MKITGIINSLTKPKDYQGFLQIGFTLKSDSKLFYNVSGDKEILEDLLKTIVIKGAEISFGYDAASKKVSELKLEKEATKSDYGDMMNLDKLLGAAHERFKNMLEIKTKLISIDHEKKIAVFKARVVVMAKDKESIQYFEAHGDAKFDDLNKEIKEHYIRMAETRAICRALRWATNNAQCSEEEK